VEEPAILVAEEIGASKVTACVTGGATRSASVADRARRVPRMPAVVLVHDAARPFLPADIVPRLLGALGEGFDGRCARLPLADTVKRVRDGVVIETPSRDELVAVQTPQASSRACCDRLPLEKARTGASLVEAVGGRVKVVPGDERLLKVTTPMTFVESRPCSRPRRSSLTPWRISGSGWV